MERFLVINKIGEGAYSTVYTVKRLEDEKIYALKKVKIKPLSAKEKANALNEVRILASINSPYIIGYKESFIDETDQTLCIVMEYADDGDLYQKIKLYTKNNTCFMEEDIWSIFIQITKGLHDLHEYDILHRDLKSANVFLFKDGKAKLGDLNVSKITTRGLGCTQTGTPYYASPEVWRDNPYNLKSDIWSLGCVFYELIMLKTPFRADSMKDLYKKVMKGEYPPIPDTFSPKFQIVIDRILKVKSEERPNTTDILDMPEVVEKITELNIFKKIKKMKTILNSVFYKTSYDINQRMKFNKNLSESALELNDNYNKNNDNEIDEFMITRLNNMNNDNDNDGYNKWIDKKSSNNRSCEINNDIINGKSIKYHIRTKKDEEIYKIYKKNIDYFKKKYNEKKKIVLNTIKYPNKLSNLNSKLPDVKYDNEYINNNEQKKRIHRFFLSPNQLLPQIKSSKRKSKKEIKMNEEKKNDTNRDNNSNNRQLNSSLNYNKKYLLNTLQMKINQKHPFNYKGKIDIIIEE